MHKVIIVDDHPLMRAGLKYIIEQSGQYSVVGEAATGEAALPLIEEHRPGRKAWSFRKSKRVDFFSRKKTY